MSDESRPRRSTASAAKQSDAAAGGVQCGEGTGTLSFEQALAALENVVRDLECGELGLSEMLARYEEGVKYLKECYGQLATAERRVELLKHVDAHGRALTEPFDEQTMTLEEKAASRGARRSSSRSRSARPDTAPGSDEAVDGPTGLF
jgi:exodeoxyribonuclease VII small subunit